MITQKGLPKSSCGSTAGSLSVKELFLKENTRKYKQKRKPKKSNKVCKSWMLHTCSAQEAVLRGGLPWRLKDGSKKKIRSESEVLGSSQTSPQLPQKWGQVEICPCLLLKQAGTGQDETGTGRRVAQEPPGDVTFTGATPQAATIPGRKDFITAHQECCLCTALLSHNEE